MADESERARIEREHRATEEKGVAWQARSDEFLVGYVSEQNRPGQFHTPAIVEMQRRHMAAVREFNDQANRQAITMIRLTRAITWLTVAIGLIGVVQLWTMLSGGA